MAAVNCALLGAEIGLSWVRTHWLIQKMTDAAMQIADMYVWAQRPYLVAKRLFEGLFTVKTAGSAAAVRHHNLR